jgi:hypothetical protein
VTEVYLPHTRLSKNGCCYYHESFIQIMLSFAEAWGEKTLGISEWKGRKIHF